MKRKGKKYKKVSTYVISTIAVFMTLLAGIPSCSNKEVQTEQFDNNSSGMDRDHTQVHKDDTLNVNSSEIKDSTVK